MSTPHRRRRRALQVGATGAAVVALAACTGQPSEPAPSTSSSTSPTSSSSATSGTTTSAAPSSSTTTTTPAPTCGERLAARMTPAQRAGQLLMVGLAAGSSPRALATQVQSRGIGSVIYLGGWQSGSTVVAKTSRQLQAAAGGALLIAADQEGGEVQQLRGPGFSRLPSARTQATVGAAAEEKQVEAWSRELKAAGVNVNLAPVADTVPTSLGAGNAPIGRYRRDFAPGSPATNARYAAAFVRGTLAAGVAPTAKHFPGLGRVTGNTDVTATGITDTTTGPDDAYLAPFSAAIKAGVPLVMMSSARYPRLDPDAQAVFSRAVVTDLLRDRLGFEGVVITDDVGAARAVAAVPVGQRATRFIAAGGDIVLTARPEHAAPMLAAIAAKRKASPAFARQVDAAAARVLDLKGNLGLVRCS